MMQAVDEGFLYDIVHRIPHHGRPVVAAMLSVEWAWYKSIPKSIQAELELSFPTSGRVALWLDDTSGRVALWLDTDDRRAAKFFRSAVIPRAMPIFSAAFLSIV